MSTNAELAAIFDQMSAMLELLGANVFRVNAHANVARILRDLTEDVSTLADDKKKLTAIDGIGDGSARKIIEYVNTGEVSEHQELLEQVPVGLLDVMKIPGLGPKTVKLLWEEGGVTDLESLSQALESGQLEGLPRMGAKTIQNIRESLEFLRQSAKRTRLGQALPAAEAIIEKLRKVKGVQELAYAGSLRRGRETIGDIDILAAATDPAALASAFREMDDVTRVLVGGETKSSVRLEMGIQVDLRIVEKDSFGAALLYFTGSKEHNVVLRERAQKRSLRLNEYGLYPEDGKPEPPQNRGVRPVASKTEQEIYEALDLPYIPPELREARGELDRKPPKLIEFEDIKAELHAHTTESDGHMTIDQVAAAAKERGFHTVAVTDHSKSSVQANGLSPDRLRKHIAAIREANERIKGITILAGSEVDILVDGKLDYDDDLLAELDIVIASPHAVLKQDPAKATKRLVKAVSHPLVHVLGHPTGRIINHRDGLSPQMDAIIETAVEHGTALELNANYFRLDLRDTHVRAAVDAGALIAINTDAHGTIDFGHLRYGVLTARRGWLTARQCLNTWSRKKLGEWLRGKR